MPYKFNEKIRDKIDKPRYKVNNWPAYNNALRNRGDFTAYFTEEAIAEWHPVKTSVRGSPQKYSALAIETSLMIRQVFRLPLRQTQPVWPYRLAKKTGYGLRNYAELAMQRYKRIFGNTMKARKLPQQKAEAWASAVALNRMTRLGMPVSVKI